MTNQEPPPQGYNPITHYKCLRSGGHNWRFYPFTLSRKCTGCGRKKTVAGGLGGVLLLLVVVALLSVYHSLREKASALKGYFKQ